MMERGNIMKKTIYLLLLPYLMLSQLSAGQANIFKTEAQPTIKDLSELRIKMARHLNDIERVEAILKEYRKLLQQIQLPEHNWKAFEDWLFDKSYFIGNKHYNHDNLFEKAKELE